MRRLGVRLSQSEIASARPVVGDFVLHDWREGNSWKRALRVAALKDLSTPTTPSRDLLPPLFDPALVRVRGDLLVVSGIEINAPEGERPIVEYAQTWLVRPLGEPR